MKFFQEKSMRDPTEDLMNQYGTLPENDMPIIDDESAMLVEDDGSLNFHARDVPEDWAEANPYSMNNAPAFGSGYEDAFAAGPALSMMPPEAPPLDPRALRDAMLEQMSGDKLRSNEYQQSAVDENQKMMRSARR